MATSMGVLVQRMVSVLLVFMWHPALGLYRLLL